MSDEVLSSTENGILIVTLNRPQAKNAADKALAEGVAAAMDELDSNDELRVAILTGAGGTFCSGMDLKAFVNGETPHIAGRGFAGLTERSPRKPLLAAVEGYALAGGLELAISCDMVVAADDARFGIPETQRGLVAGAGGLLKLPRQIPSRVAMELALTGDFISARRAYQLGLVNQLVPAGTALDAAKTLAARIAANGPLAVVASKQVIQQQADWSQDSMFERQNEICMPVFTSADAMEGAVAFAEKRAPNWQGR